MKVADAKARRSTRRGCTTTSTTPTSSWPQREGYRARAAYKLKEIDEQLHLLEPGQLVVDLGAAPGAWSQYVRRKFAPRAPAPAARPARCTARSSRSTCSPFEPIEGVDFIAGRLPRGRRSWPQLEARVGGRPVDVVRLGHGAQPVGHRSRPTRRGWPTWSSWRSISRQRHLKPEGALVCKVFHGSGYSQLVELFKDELPDRQADQAEGVAGQVGRNLPGRHRPQAALHPAPITRHSDAHMPAGGIDPRHRA